MGFLAIIIYILSRGGVTPPVQTRRLFMKPRQWILLSIAAAVIIFAVKVYAGSVSMTTYYPAPTGYYDQLKVKTKLIIPCYAPNAATPTEIGAIWIEDSDSSCVQP